MPSIGAIARLSIATRHADEPHAWAIAVDGGDKSEVRPAALGDGTRVEVRDLFYATPARLKFLKSDRAEAEAVREVVRRLAMSRPDVAFTLAGEERAPVTWAAAMPGPIGRLARLADILGVAFQSNAIAIAAARDGIAVEGHAALPTYSRGNALGQYLFVNGRPVRDKLLLGAVRGAYADHLPRDRHPIVALFVTLDPREVDVNVHPAKTEVRFRDAGLVRSLIVRALQEGLTRDSQRAATTGGSATIAAFRPVAGSSASATARSWDWRRSPSRPLSYGSAAAAAVGFAETAQAAFEVGPANATARVETHEPEADLVERPLGAARAQVHETYIVAQTRDGVVIVDQHAAHERLVYERMKTALERGIARQILLIPEIVELDEADVERLAARADELARYGLVDRAVRPGRGRGARDAVDAGRDRRRRAHPRPRRAHGGMGRGAAARAQADARRRHHGVPRLGARRPPPQGRGDERAPARDGGDAEFRPVQPRPPDLRGAEAHRHRAAVWAAVNGIASFLFMYIQ